MFRILLATFLGAVTAGTVAASIAALVWPLSGGSDQASDVFLHVLVLGWLIIFPVAFLAGMPLYYLFRWRGWLSTHAVVGGGTALALVYPLLVWIDNKPGFISFWHFFVCGVAGFAASMVFVLVSGMRRVHRRSGQANA